MNIGGDDYKEKLASIKDIENLKEQISTVRDVCTSLTSGQVDIRPVLQLLVDVYLTFPAKHQVKRIIVSAFQSLSAQSSEYAVQELTNQVGCYYKQPIDKTDLRKHVDIIAGLLDNFPSGEKCIEYLSLETLQYLSQILDITLEENSSTQSSIRQNELMHTCLASVQAGNRVMQKCYSALKGREELSNIVSVLLKHDITILHADDFLMDSKTTCAINVILLMRLQYGDRFIHMVRQHIFETSENTEFDKLIRGSNSTGRLCLMYGIMSIIELSELVKELHDGKCLLLDYLFTCITQISLEGYTDSISKLLVVKCYNMWASKSCSVLKSEILSEKQKALLTGSGHMMESVMSYIWTVWEDSTDVIRIIAREIFENVLQIHTMVVALDICSDPFVQGLTQRLIFDVNWSSKGKYGMLSILVQVIGTSHILQLAPDLSSIILSHMSEHALACHASELYVQLCWKHQTESPDMWISVWIDPILEVLSGNDKQQTNNVIEYILTKLLKTGKELLTYILKKLSTQSDTSQMSTLVTCLRRARVMGLLDKQLETEENVDRLINISVLEHVLCHIDDQVRLDGFAFICESHRTTAVVNSWELKLIKNFLPWNLNSQSPAFRQQMLSHLKKLICRMKESETVLLRQEKKSGGITEIQLDTVKNSLKQYKEFLSWLTRHLFCCLYPGSSYARKTTCLCALTLLVDIFGPVTTPGFTVSSEIAAEDFSALVDCLTDTFEDNKMEAYKLLKYCSELDFMKQPFESVDKLLETALTLAGSTRPQDSTTAAYLFKVLLLQTEVFSVMSSESLSRSFINSCINAPLSSESNRQSNIQHQLPEIEDGQLGSVLYLLLWLIEYLKSQIKMARQSLMMAACNKPLYPTLLSIRYVLQDVNFRSIPSSSVTHWKKIIASLLDSCLQISEIVSPVVQNSSPEGNIPIEVIGDMKGKADDHTIMPEYLTVCCWRSIKEVSLILGQICTTVPVTDKTAQTDGLLTCTQMDEIGAYFKTQLLESIHRGAFELAYAGFVKMCDMLWRSSIEELYKLPKFWLSQLMSEVKSVSSKLCATRRSAGVPFYVQALVTTEPVTTGRQCFKQAMTDLLKLALTEESSDLFEPKVHSLNILRAMYRDTRLGEDVTPFVAGGLQATILGFKSKFWAVCNSSTLLFSALMTRIFGVKRSKDESHISKKNCQTGKAFFHKYPGLYNYMLDLLAEATENVGVQGTVHLHPSLYPLLMVLARLFPSPLEGTDTSLNLSSFIPYIIRCSCSAVLKTRQMAAKALQPLVVSSNIVDVGNNLLQRLSVDSDGVQYNHIHGVLLQINSLMEIIPSMDVSIRQFVLSIMVKEWWKRKWLISKQNICFVVRKEALNFTSKLLLETGQHNEDINSLQNNFLTIMEEEELTLSEPFRQTLPGYMEYLTTLVNMLLCHNISRSDNCNKENNWARGDNDAQDCDKGDNLSDPMDKEDNCLIRRLLLVLDCCHYEIRMIGLMYLHRLSTDEELGEDVVFSCTVTKVDINVATMILSSKKVLKKLLHMMMAESHFECQKLLMKTLIYHPSFTDFSWFEDNVQLLQIFKHCLSYIENTSRDELRAEMLHVTGFLVEPLLKCVTQGKFTDSNEGQALLVQWKDMLDYYKGTEHHCQLQMSVVKILYTNTEILLTDSMDFWGNMTFTFWDILVNLLQEDDEDVKTTAARVIHKLNPKLQVDVHPFLALDLTIGYMVQLHHKKHRLDVWKTLVKWIDISQEDDTEEECRLFDKNEMNTWREDVQFVKIVTKYIISIVLSVDKSTDLNGLIGPNGGNTEYLTETVTEAKFLDQSVADRASPKLTVIRDKLLQLHSDLLEELPSNQAVILDQCPGDVYTSFCDVLRQHLAMTKQSSFNINLNPFKDANKYIQWSVNKFKLETIIHLYECMYDNKL